MFEITQDTLDSSDSILCCHGDPTGDKRFISAGVFKVIQSRSIASRELLCVHHLPRGSIIICARVLRSNTRDRFRFDGKPRRRTETARRSSARGRYTCAAGWGWDGRLRNWEEILQYGFAIRMDSKAKRIRANSTVIHKPS